ncbi:p36 protein, putative [Eimeria tenella]|uniref:p36 protein, putative n=1 Tax=Eimeria tenella TaxID=5802 RepID=U6KHU8_EIMTE|nr:p36 protein, putative [Eimeria tenella]CDJ37514.1 p36 protein, putative [Eimeria tenella]|eukprot:XP_013228352.1 p36 protein, putative [Eimeria tenella]
MALPSTAAESSFSKGTKALRLKKLLCKALSAKEPCTALADAVKTGGIRVIAVDFDLTMITVHSGGSASNVPDNPIFTSLSPDFDAFASAVTSRGIPIAVVTFGDPRAIASRPDRIAGEPLVQRVLEGSAASFKVDAVFPFYPPLYQWPADYKVLGLKEPMPFSKSFHISKVLEHFGVSKEQVLLIDDDPNNCSAFAAEGGVSLRVAGDRGFDCANLEVV